MGQAIRCQPLELSCYKTSRVFTKNGLTSPEEQKAGGYRFFLEPGDQKAYERVVEEVLCET